MNVHGGENFIFSFCKIKVTVVTDVKPFTFNSLHFLDTGIRGTYMKTEGGQNLIVAKTKWTGEKNEMNRQSVLFDGDVLMHFNFAKQDLYQTCLLLFFCQLKDQSEIYIYIWKKFFFWFIFGRTITNFTLLQLKKARWMKGENGMVIWAVLFL